MKTIFRIAFAAILFCVYTSCQKEVNNTLPLIIGQDSTGTDSTLVEIRDSLAIVSFTPDSGAIGSAVQITGIGFSAVADSNAVRINNTPAPITSASKNKLTIQVPQGSTSGKITVTVNGRTAASLRDFIVKAAADSVVSGTDQWKQKADFPLTGEATAITAIAVGDKGYLLKGHDLWEYTPSQDKWTKKANQPSGPGGFYSFAFLVNNNIYFGSNGDYMPDSVALWEYSIASNSWARKKNLPIAPRLAAFGFAVNNTGYVGGGQTGFDADNMQAHDFWKYNASNDSWSKQADFPGTWTISLSSFVINNEAYVYDAGMGFPQAPTSNIGSGKLWHYNATTNKWTEKATCPGGVNAMSAVAFSIGTKGYVAVSVLDRQESPRDDFWMYDPNANNWTKKADVGGGLHWFGSGFAIGGKGYVGLGTGNTIGDQKKDFWEYTP